MKTIIDAEMREYLDGAYADSGTARNQLLYFAELVTEQANARANNSWALMCEKMVAAEREACAKVCDRVVEGKAEALKLALIALRRSRNAVSGDADLKSSAYGSNDRDGHRYDDAKMALVTLDKAVIAIKEALAQPGYEFVTYGKAWSTDGKTWSSDGEVTDLAGLLQKPPKQKPVDVMKDPER